MSTDLLSSRLLYSLKRDARNRRYLSEEIALRGRREEPDEPLTKWARSTDYAGRRTAQPHRSPNI